VPERRSFGGIRVSVTTRTELLAVVRERIGGRAPVSITFLNPDYARRAFRDGALRACIDAFDVVLVDGNGVKWTAPLFGFRVPERLDADGLAPALFGELADGGAGVYLFGGAPGVADRAAERLAAALPGLRIVGTEHGYWDVERGHPGRFDPVDSARIVDAMNAVGADFVFVGLPTPLQQRWTTEHRGAIAAPVVMTGGSLLDHIAENEAWPSSWYPDWANRWRLNWLYRLAREPRRLWRRYTIELADFAVLALRARFRDHPDRTPGTG
jgi:N-acetylglucosaminyldiphosphoundecaprenol N-acetyl-beta-D-mannosaminyltransferase